MHVHVRIDNMALNVALSIANICTGQHDTMQNIISPKARIATAQVTIFNPNSHWGVHMGISLKERQITEEPMKVKI